MSFADQHEVKHLNFKTGPSCLLLTTNDGDLKFQNIYEVVQYFQQTGLFKTPYPNPYSEIKSIISEWKEEILNLESAIDAILRTPFQDVNSSKA